MKVKHAIQVLVVEDACINDGYEELPEFSVEAAMKWFKQERPHSKAGFELRDNVIVIGHEDGTYVLVRRSELS